MFRSSRRPASSQGVPTIEQNLRFMRLSFAPLLALLLAAPALAADAPLAYPSPPHDGTVATFFGTSVPDPYRPMENVDAPDVATWANAENALTHRYLDAVPVRPAIAEAFRKLYDYEKISAPYHVGKHWFVARNSGLQTQSPIYIRDSETGPERLFFDPNTLSKDGSIQVAGQSYTKDGTLLAYATSEGGADWQTWHVKRVPSGVDTTDRIEWSKFSGAAWLGDSGFYYSGYDAPKNGNKTLSKLDVQKVWFHKLGTAQRADRLVYASTQHPDEFVGVEVTYDQKFVFLERSKGDGNSLAWKRASEPDTAFRPVFDLDPNVEYDYLGNDGTRVYARTNKGAKQYRIVDFDLTDPSHALHDLVPQTADKLESVSLIGNKFYLGYLHDAHSAVRIADLRGRSLGDIRLPGIGTGGVPEAQRDERIAYTSFTSFAYPTITLRYDTATGTGTIIDRSKVAFDPAPFVTEQIFATSKDGTRVPIFVTHRRDIVLDGNNPTILYGYGGFNISLTPYFSTQDALWLQMGGVYAVATLRGGGEYGDAWHDAGRLGNKQHVFDDFIAAAQTLIDRKYTSTPKLAIDGGSNGGLLVGATVTQRPDLFGAAVAEQGVLDMLRFHRFTVGKAWITEYGSADASADQFKTLLAYSPLNNVKAGTHYPPILITTSDHDDRVFPAHSYKFAAALQAAQAGDAPILLRVETNEGHFSGLTTEKRIAITADYYAFICKSLGFNPTFGDAATPASPAPTATP
jgi:prolyl oligopeptidase